MDKEQARFILQSFRPDGADAQDPDFAEALAVAAEDRELGEWLASERAQDAAFAAALNELAIPEGLRAHILTVLRGEHPEDEFGEMDAAFIGALATVRPPEGLREQIVTAMKVETTSGASASVKSAPQRTWNWLKAAAVAAALVLGAFVALELTGQKDTRTAKGDESEPVEKDRLSLVALENQSIREVAFGPNLELVTSELKDLNSYLHSKNVPGASEDKLPPGLEGVKAVGCKLLELGKTNASLLCFDKNGQSLHLVVVRREDLEETKLATLANVKSKKGSCRQCPATKVSVATWGDDERAFALLSKTDPDDLLEFF